MYIVGVIGQILFGLYWMKSGVDHLKNISGLTSYAKSKKVPQPKLAVILTGVILVLGGAGIALGIYVVQALWLIIIFLVPTTFMMHAFWRVPKESRNSEQMSFYRNVAFLGVLLMLLAMQYSDATYSSLIGF